MRNGGRTFRFGCTAEILAPVPDAILNPFAPEGMLTAADVEAATRRLRRRPVTRGHFPTDEAAITLMWLAIRTLTAR